MKEIRIVVKGRELNTSVKGEVDGAFLVPLQETAHALGMVGKQEGSRLILYGKREVIVDGQYAFFRDNQQKIPITTKLKDGKLLAPANLLAACLEVRLLWNKSARTLLFLEKEKSLVNKKIVLDPGHGGRDLGVRGAVLTEKELTLVLVKSLGKLLACSGAEVVCTRSQDRCLPTKRRVQLTAQQKPDLFLSVHTNHFHDPRAGGIETYYFRSWQGQRLATLIQRELAGELALEDRGGTEASFQLLRSMKVPAAVVKVLYLSNPAEEYLAADSWFRLRIVLGLYRAVKAFFS